MRNRKRRFEIFSFYDRRGIERHLEKMAEKGWMIEQILTYYWIYRRICPGKRHFCVTFLSDASDYNPEVTEDQREFQDFCAHTGWTPAASRGQMLIFCNERENPVPIETEPQVEIDAIHKGMVKMYLIPYAVLMLLSAVIGGITLLAASANPVDALADPGTLFLLFDFAALFILCAAETGGYYLWRRRARKAAGRGEFLDGGRGATLFERILLSVVAAGFAGYLIGLAVKSEITALKIVIMIPVFLAGAALLNRISKFFRRRNMSASANKALSFGLTYVFFFLAFLGIGLFPSGMEEKGLFASDGETYEYRGHTYTAWKDELPLTVGDLLGTADEGYSMRRQDSVTLLAYQFKASQQPRMDADNAAGMPWMDYTVTEISVPVLYRICRDHLIHEKQDVLMGDELYYYDRYDPVDASSWGAEEAYRHHWIEGYSDDYLLFYEDRIVQIRFGWEPDETQMRMVSEKLQNL